MVFKDFLVTPIFLLFLYLLAFLLRPFFTDSLTQRYFLSALTLKFFGAIALGLIYQFYYGGGDTFGYTTYGGGYIWKAFQENPAAALKLIFLDNEYRPDTLKYALRMWYFDDAPTYFVVRVAGLIGLFTFDTYSSTALIFAALSFSGLWAMYMAFYRRFPEMHLRLALAIFFVPSVIFWGSGVMKDTLTLGALGWLVYALFNVMVFKEKKVFSWIIILVFSYIIFTIKIYILLCFVPSVFLWLFFSNIEKIPSRAVKVFLIPFVLISALTLSTLGVVQIGRGNERYSFSRLLETAEITAKDNSLWTVRKEGSGYNLGDYDFSPAGIARKFIPAVVVTLFRPYLWEVKNPVMLLSALESFGVLVFSVYLLIRNGLFNTVILISKNAVLIFCITFAVSFAFAVGLSSGNFGSLVRYKIPIIPFFLIALFLVDYLTAMNKATPTPLSSRGLAEKI